MIISQTPLRLSFVGGGTDFQDFYRVHKGQVISASIDKYIYVIVKKRYDDLIVLHYTENEIVGKVEDIRHEIIREALSMLGIKKGIEIITLADITMKGSGLGSSSVLTVGLLNALHHYLGESVSSEQLAKEACELEINRLCKPIGKQDQYIAAYGGIKKFIFHPDESVEVVPFRLQEDTIHSLNTSLILHNTGVTRKAEMILQEQNDKTASNVQELQTISGLVDTLHAAFDQGNHLVLGELLKINWEMKRKLASGINIPVIEEMITIAGNNGASGCKIVGAGGGGFIMSYVPAAHLANFKKAMLPYQELPFHFDPHGTRILINVF